MNGNSKLLKLLETASHPTASDGERLNALNAFRRFTDRAGGIDAALGAHFQLGDLKVQLENVQRELESAMAANALLEQDREVLARAIEALKRADHAGRNPTQPPQHDADAEFVRSALSNDWQELHRIHEKAKSGGLAKPSKATQECLERLVSQRVAVSREAGRYRDRRGTYRWQPPSWRLKRLWEPPF